MGKSTRYTASDIGTVFRSVGECVELWDDPVAWETHLLQRLAELAETELAAVIYTPLTPDPLDTWGHRTVVNLEPDLARAYFYDVSEHDMADLPGVAMLMHDVHTTGSASRTLGELARWEDYERTASYQNVHRNVDMCDFLSLFRLAPAADAMLLISTHRRGCKRLISQRATRRAALLADHIAPLVGTRLATRHQRSRHGLSPRQRDTLCALLEGCSEKQIARRLDLAIATVHQYVTAVYRHFDVTSRGELMSYFVRRAPAAAGSASV